MKKQNQSLQKSPKTEIPTEATGMPPHQSGYRYRTVKNGIEDDGFLNRAYRIPGTASTMLHDASMGGEHPP